MERRRKPDEVRRDALEVARGLLIEGGPGAITLKAIGAALGMSHANLIHHFGSAEQLRAQLRDRMVQDLTRTATALLERRGEDDATLATIVDQVFDTYASGGIGMLMAWTATHPVRSATEEAAHATRALIAVLSEHLDGASRVRVARDMVSLVTLLAFAHSLIGRGLAASMDDDPAATRGLTVRVLAMLRDARHAVPHSPDQA